MSVTIASNSPPCTYSCRKSSIRCNSSSQRPHPDPPRGDAARQAEITAPPSLPGDIGNVYICRVTVVGPQRININFVMGKIIFFTSCCWVCWVRGCGAPPASLTVIP